ncbi:uncharacterized protein LOC126679405 [Mercurialis annua]|uniref:uncharacterized protein LOC126679405 n=1 Tax=Mercurialis annua TaxID=3986 RepID=UPI00215FBBD5|nr:uncharacterized protein LOC126679405 [Mercurialis annua]
MSNNRRRPKGEIFNPEVRGTISQSKKPPFHGNWQLTVPAWEKRFCSSVGLVPWRKLLETKKFMYLYENVVQWNDSAVEEAFNNAKIRFWAEINGFPCDISLPDPDIYIDEIDWSSDISSELYLDLDREPKYPAETDKKEEVIIFGSSLLNQSFSCIGWGEAEEDLQKAAAKGVDPRCRDCDRKGDDENPWATDVYQADGAIINNEQKNCWDDSYKWKSNSNEWGKTYNEWGSSYNEWNTVDDRTGGVRGTWDENSRKREDAGRYMSRYKTSRFHGDDYQMDRGWWRNGRGRKRMNVY